MYGARGWHGSMAWQWRRSVALAAKEGIELA